MSAPRPGDLSAGFVGLAVSVIFLLAAVFTIIALTNKSFAGHEPTAAAPGAHSAAAASDTAAATSDTAAARPDTGTATAGAQPAAH
jgi:hypothetical protein